MMQGTINTNYVTSQSDLFTSGVAAEIGMNAFGVWQAIKSHADFSTGVCYPGMRRLAKLTGLSLGCVSNSVQTLVDAKLLRIVTKGQGKRGNKYIARERLDVRLGSRVLCTVVLDYVPLRLRTQVEKIEEKLKVGEPDDNLFANCEIIPGEGFIWDTQLGMLKAAVRAREIPIPAIDESAASMQSELVQKVLALQRKAMRRSRNMGS
jgi:hypothetical protein